MLEEGDGNGLLFFQFICQKWNKEAILQIYRGPTENFFFLASFPSALPVRAMVTKAGKFLRSKQETKGKCQEEKITRIVHKISKVMQNT